MSANAVPSAIAASLLSQADPGKPQHSDGDAPDLTQLADLLGEQDLPPIRSVAGLLLTRPDGVERRAIVLLRERGFTWIGGGDNPQVAFVETDDELAKLVASFIGFGEK